MSSLNKSWKNFLSGGKDLESNYPTHKKGVDRGFKMFEDKYDPKKYVKVRIVSDVKFPVDWDEGRVLLSNQKPTSASLQSGFMMLKKAAQKNAKKSAGCCGLFSSKRDIKEIGGFKGFVAEAATAEYQCIDVPAI